MNRFPHEQHYALPTPLLHPALAMLHAADAAVVYRILCTAPKGNRVVVRPAQGEA